MRSTQLVSTCLLLICLLGFNLTPMLGQSGVDDTCDPIDSVFIIDTNGVVEIYWIHDDTVLAYNVRVREIGGSDTNYMVMSTLTQEFIIEDFDGGCFSLEVGIRPVCPFDTSAYTVDTFEIFCTSVWRPETPEEVTLVYPTLFSDHLYWQPSTAIGSLWQLYDSGGRLVQQGRHEADGGSIQTRDVPNGLYLLLVQDGQHRHVQRLMKY